MSQQPADLSSYTLEHIDLIKAKLLQIKRNYENEHNLKPITAYEIHQQFTSKKMYCPSIPTIQKLLDPNFKQRSSSIDITLIAQLCKWFNGDLAYVLALPEDKSISPDFKQYGNNFTAFDHPHYQGQFHGYMLRPADISGAFSKAVKNDTMRKNDTIVHCILEFKMDGANSFATMKTFHPDFKNPSEEHLVTTYKGYPVYCKETNNVFIDFIAENGTYFHIMFARRPFRRKTMYYREASVITTTASEKSVPLFSKMVICRNEIPADSYTYLRGLLSLNVNTVIISEEKLNRLSESDREIQQFVREFGKYLPIYKRNFYVIPDSCNEHNPDSTFSTIDFKKVLLKLSNHSYSMAQVTLGTDEAASSVAKALQHYNEEESET